MKFSWHLSCAWAAQAAFPLESSERRRQFLFQFILKWASKLGLVNSSCSTHWPHEEPPGGNCPWLSHYFQNEHFIRPEVDLCWDTILEKYKIGQWGWRHWVTRIGHQEFWHSHPNSQILVCWPWRASSTWTRAALLPVCPQWKFCLQGRMEIKEKMLRVGSGPESKIWACKRKRQLSVKASCRNMFDGSGRRFRVK